MRRCTAGGQGIAGMNEAGPRVVVVTGASRGAGKGIAIALGATGATVYVTGRSQQEGDAMLPGTVGATAAAVTAAGGRGIAVACDHRDDAQVAALFERVRDEQRGQHRHPRQQRLPHSARTHAAGALLAQAAAHAAAVRRRHAFALRRQLARGAADGGARLRGSSCTPRPTVRCASCTARPTARARRRWTRWRTTWRSDLRPHGVAVVSLWMGLLDTERTAWAMSDPETARKYAPLREQDGVAAVHRPRDRRAGARSAQLPERSGPRLDRRRAGARVRRHRRRRSPAAELSASALGEPPRYSSTIVE
jgi:NAD(P)-dependent dehydrogenase (short-subunit alcohol dehydrogenase family)